MKTRKCSYCGNMVEDSDYSDNFELHKRDCPIREMMEVRLAYAEKDDNSILLIRGTTIVIHNTAYEITEDVEVFAKEL